MCQLGVMTAKCTTERRTPNVIRKSSLALISLLLAATVGCVDAPESVASPAALDDDPLAQTFDALAQASASNGDLARKEGFQFAALTVRSGLVPSHIEMRVASPDAEGMDAIVSAVDWASNVPASLRPPSRRALVAWRRNANGILRVISLLTPSDSAPIVSPLVLGSALNTNAVYAAASAQYQDITPQANSSLGTQTSWFATSGWVKIRQLQSTGACTQLESNTKVGGFSCETARFAVSFDLAMQALTGLPPTLVSELSIVVRTPSEQTLNGEHLTFSCASPNAQRGCK